MKTKILIVFVFAFMLCLGIVSAYATYNPKTAVLHSTDDPMEKITWKDTMEKKKPAVIVVDEPEEDVKVEKKRRRGSAFLTKLVWSIEENKCVNADILSKPFTIASTSKYKYPFNLVRINKDGSRTIQRIFDGDIGIVWDKETHRIDRTETCDVNSMNEPIELNWWNR